MLRTNDKRGYAVAAFAAVVLFISSVLSAWAADAMPVWPTLDQFGNPLCITSGEHGQPTQHGEAPNCCTMGCMSAAALHAGPSAKLAYLIEIPDYVASDWLVFAKYTPRPQFRQNGPRAPPMMPDRIIV